MCIATPMQVIEPEGIWAWCEDGGRRERVDMRLVGQQPPGSWVLVFLGAAREVVDPARARQTLDALAALRAAGAGDSVEHLFADLIDREPQLPEYLKKHYV